MNTLATIKHIARVAIAYALFYSGILTLLKVLRLRNRVVVLMYHRVLTDDERERAHSTAGIVVTRDTFRRHLAFLSRHFRMIGPEALLDHLNRRQPLTGTACLITFDDGWSDNYRNAYPLLVQHKVPATIFLPTSFIGTQRQFWQERMTRLLRELHHKVRHASRLPAIANDRPALQTLWRGSPGAADRAIDTLVRTFKHHTMDEIERFIAELESALPAGNRSVDESDFDGFMDWNQVREMASAGISFGSHAVSHRLLDKLDPADVDTELKESRAIIEQQVGKPVRLLAYPNGNHNADVVRSAERCGYAAAFTTQPGVVSTSDHPLTLARLNVHDGLRHPPVLLAFMVGAF